MGKTAGKGEELGGNTVAAYMDESSEWFAGECKEKGRKMSAAQMREALL